MQNNHLISANHERDPIAVFVEKELQELARTSEIKTNLNRVNDRNVELRFDDVVVHGETRDIALLRLASALLGVERFRLALTEALGPELHANSHPHTGVNSTDGSRMSAPGE